MGIMKLIKVPALLYSVSLQKPEEDKQSYSIVLMPDYKPCIINQDIKRIFLYKLWSESWLDLPASPQHAGQVNQS